MSNNLLKLCITIQLNYPKKKLFPYVRNHKRCFSFDVGGKSKIIRQKLDGNRNVYFSEKICKKHFFLKLEEQLMFSMEISFFPKQLNFIDVGSRKQNYYVRDVDKSFSASSFNFIWNTENLFSKVL